MQATRIIRILAKLFPIQCPKNPMNTKIKMPIMITMKEYRLVGLLFLLINSRVIIEMSQVKKKLKANGTAVEGVCVTGAASRVLVPVVSSGAVPVAS